MGTALAHWRKASRSTVIFSMAVLLLSACGSRTDADYLRDGQTQLAAGNVPAAVIDFRNALQKNGRNLEARILLARSLVDLGDAIGAQGEIATAAQYGAAPGSLAQVRGEADLLSGDANRALADAAVPKNASPELAAGISSVRARTLIALGRLGEAREAIEGGLSRDPKSLDLLMARSQLALGEKDMAAANSYLGAAAKVAPADYRVAMLKGDIAFAAGDFAGAEAAYGSVIKAHSWNMQARLRLARAQIARQEIKQAAATLAVLLKAAPKDPNVNYLEAVTKYQARDYAAALSYSQVSLGTAQTFLPAQLVAGASSYALGQWEQASNYLTHYVFEVPNSEQARLLLARVQMRLGHPNDAVSTLKPALSIPAGATDASDTNSHGDVPVLALIGTAAAQSGDYEDAAHYFQAAVAKNPNDATLRQGLGSAELSLGQTESGITDLERAQQQEPKAVAPALALFFGYIRAKNFAKALETAETLAKNRPQDPLGDDLVGLAREANGESDAARSAWTKALQLKPDDPTALQNLAVLAIKEGNFGSAIENYERLLKANPKNQTAAIALAQVELRQGKSDAAAATLQKAIAGNPSADAAREALGRLDLGENHAQNAIDTVAPILAAHPDNSAALEVTGSAQLALGQSENASSTFQRLVGAAPNSAASHQLLGSAYLAKNDVTSALRELKTAVDLNPKDDAAKLLEAQALSAGGQYAEALSLVATLEAAYPKQAKVKELKGLIALAQNRADDAAAAFTDALKLGDNGLDRERLAQAEARGGHVDAAVKTLQPWIAAHPADTTAQLALVGIRLDAQQWEEAVSEARSASMQQPKSEPLAISLVRVLLATHHDAEARAAADQLVRAFPKDAAAHDAAGMTALAENQPSDAVAEFKSALALADNNIIRGHLSDALLKSGRPQEAEGTIRPWVEAHPNDVASRMVLGDIYIATNRLDEARQQYEAVLDLQPNNVIAENNIAWALTGLHRSNEALAHAQHASTIAPKSADVLDTLGDIQRQIGKTSDAVRTLQQAATLQPANPAIQFHLAEALASNSQKEQARKILKTLVMAPAQATNASFDRNAAQKLLTQLGG